MDDKVREQAVNVASLPGIVRASFVMPDAHWGYGFPLGGVAAFDAERGGVVAAGGVGFDVSCGVRCLHTGLTHDDVMPVQRTLADALFTAVPAGMGSRGTIHLIHQQTVLTVAGRPPHGLTDISPARTSLFLYCALVAQLVLLLLITAPLLYAHHVGAPDLRTGCSGPTAYLADHGCPPEQIDSVTNSIVRQRNGPQHGGPLGLLRSLAFCFRMSVLPPKVRIS